MSVDDKELLLSVQSSPTPFEESITQPSVQPSVSFSPRSSQHSSSKNPDEESVELVQEADLLSQMDEFSTDLTLAQAHREVLQDLDEAREHNNQLERDLLQTQTEAEELRNQVKELQVELEAVRKSNQGLMMHVTELEQTEVELRLMIGDLEDHKKTLTEELVNCTADVSADYEGLQNRVKELEKITETLQEECDEAHQRETITHEAKEQLQSQLEEMRKTVEQSSEVSKSEILSLATTLEETREKLTAAESSLQVAETTISQQNHDLSMEYVDGSIVALLQMTSRRADDRVTQLITDLENTQTQLQSAHIQIDQLQTQLTEAEAGTLIETPSGPLNTNHPDSIHTYIFTLSERISLLESKLNTTKKEKEDELKYLREVQSVAVNQSKLVAQQLTKTRSELTQSTLLCDELQNRLQEKEKEIGELQKQVESKQADLQWNLQKNLKEIQDALKEERDRTAMLQERLELAKTSIQKRDRVIEASKAANDKLRRNEEVYKTAIAELKRFAKEREEELNELYKSMRGLKVSNPSQNGV